MFSVTVKGICYVSGAKLLSNSKLLFDFLHSPQDTDQKESTKIDTGLLMMCSNIICCMNQSLFLHRNYEDITLIKIIFVHGKKLCHYSKIFEKN